jgi:hypothetical protein
VHPAAQPLAQVGVLTVPMLDRVTIAAEDEQRALNGQAARFAIAFPVAANPNSHGTWDVLDGTWSLWRLRVQAPDSNHINLGFSSFQLPATARLMLYAADGSDEIRPFTSEDHQPLGGLWTPVVQTSEVVVELYVPTAARGQVQLQLAQVNSGYRFFGAGYDALGTDGSSPCQVDVRCAQGNSWQAEYPAVAMITIGGTSQCSGAMLNNTAFDLKRYFLTADHCGATSAAAAATVVFYWRYEEPTCGGAGAPTNQFTTGATLRATWATSDFTLLEVNTAPNTAWGVNYLGWNRTNAASANATGIHHPSGDAKKISLETAATQLTDYGSAFTNPGGGYIRVIDWDTGVTEGGSSGSPLFDQNRRVIGQLSGGGSACTNNASDWYGKFARSWAGGGTAATRLSNWLDPLNTGVSAVNTLVPTVAAVANYGTGCYLQRSSFAQTFALQSFDLSGTASVANVIAMVPTSNGYTVQNAPSAWFAPTTPDLALGDEGLATLNLPFSFSFPGGTTNVLRISANGFVWLNGTATDPDRTPSVIDLAQGAARIAPLWLDLNPAAGGSVHFDVDPSGTSVYLTWANVPAFAAPTAGGNTAQLALHADGSAEFRYLQVPSQPTTCVVGYSRGGVTFPLNTDLSSALPFLVGLDLNPLTLLAVGRPLVGTNQQLVLGSISSPLSSIGVMILGFSQPPAPIDLGFVGAPDCDLLVNYATLEPFLVGGTTQAWFLTIPNNPLLSGSQLFVQGGLLQNGVNPLGLMTANAVALTLGLL